MLSVIYIWQSCDVTVFLKAGYTTKNVIKSWYKPHAV